MPTCATLPPAARSLHEPIADLSIVSPHGHCDPQWWAQDKAFPNPAALLIQPDHDLFRVLYSPGVALSELGIGPGGEGRDPRDVFRFSRCIGTRSLARRAASGWYTPSSTRWGWRCR